MATGSCDSNAHVWDVSSGACVKMLKVGIGCKVRLLAVNQLTGEHFRRFYIVQKDPVPSASLKCNLYPHLCIGFTTVEPLSPTTIGASEML